MGGLDAFIKQVDGFRARCKEKKIIVEVTKVAEAIKACHAGVDGIQFDNMPCAEVARAMEVIRGINPTIILLATGRINEDNADQFARTGIDAIVTSAVYFGKPVDIGTKMEKI